MPLTDRHQLEREVASARSTRLGATALAVMSLQMHTPFFRVAKTKVCHPHQKGAKVSGL